MNTTSTTPGALSAESILQEGMDRIERIVAGKYFYHKAKGSKITPILSDLLDEIAKERAREIESTRTPATQTNGDAVAESVRRINEYLQAGGLFNPEMMEHDKVRDMLKSAEQALRAAADLAREVAELRDLHAAAAELNRLQAQSLVERLEELQRDNAGLAANVQRMENEIWAHKMTEKAMQHGLEAAESREAELREKVRVLIADWRKWPYYHGSTKRRSPEKVRGMRFTFQTCADELEAATADEPKVKE